MKTYLIYTDGSHFKGKGSGRLGVGGVLVDPDGTGKYGKEVASFSQEMLQSFMKTTYSGIDVSNPTMELYAVLFALKEFKGSYSAQNLIIIRNDYLGVSKWLNDEWKINKPYIRSIYNEIKKLVHDQGLNVKFEWVKGHQKVHDQDSYWNDVVDKLSKGQ